MLIKKRPLALVLTIGGAAIFGCASKDKKTDPRPIESVPPKLSQPDVKRVWIPDRVEGNRFEQGHWLYVIDKPISFKKE